MNCPRHPKVETNLRCGKCDQPICVKCAVPTPVGARCPDCAKVSRLPTFKVSVLDYAKASAVGLVLAVGLGIGWEMAHPHLWGFSFLGILLAALVIGELMSRAVNRKRSRGLRIIAGVCVGVCYAVAVIFGLPVGIFNILSLVGGMVVVVGLFR